MSARLPDVALADICSPFSAFRPPKRVSVAQGAADVLMIKQPGGYDGPWSPTETPYMVEPMNMLASRAHEAVCFVGPARTGKTMGLLDAWMAHTVICDPGDMLIVQMTQEKARDFSKTRIDRAIRYSPKLQAMRTGRTSDDNTHDKTFKNGMWVKIAWPTVSNLSSSDYRYVAITDRDRIEDDIDGEGDVFGLGLKRTTTFMSRGMCMIESSPGRDITDPNWKPVTPHEAPPVPGILAVYNRSDRMRWYWPCPHCGEFFEAEPGLGLFRLPSDTDLLEMVRTENLAKLAAAFAKVVCPHCACTIEEKNKYSMNQNGIWLSEEQTVSAGGIITGTRFGSSIAGYWLGGVAAAYQKWQSLIVRQLQGLREYALSGEELTLLTTANTDQGIPYTPRLLLAAKHGEHDPEGRKEDFPRFVVPNEACYLVSSVDVQAGQNKRFIVEVHAVGPNFEQWVVDRFSVTESRRPNGEGGFAHIDPGTHPEDWDRLTELVTQATYRTETEGREIRPKMVVVDTGGEDGVTANAYAWYRKLRKENKHLNVCLYKGASAKDAVPLRMTMVGAASGKPGEGDVPLALVNPNHFKDRVLNALRRLVPGPTYMHFPTWLGQSYFDEFRTEIRGKDGTYKKISERSRNESLDLSVMILVGCLRLGADKINWKNPPKWALPMPQNSDVISAEERRRLQQENKTVKTGPRQRRTAASPYLA